MRKHFLTFALIALALAWLGTAWAQFGGDATGVPGCGAEGAGNTPSGPQVPGGCGQGLPSAPPAFIPPPVTCSDVTGTINLSNGCVQPMFGGL